MWCSNATLSLLLVFLIRSFAFCNKRNILEKLVTDGCNSNEANKKVQPNLLPLWTVKKSLFLIFDRYVQLKAWRCVPEKDVAFAYQSGSSPDVTTISIPQFLRQKVPSNFDPFLHFFLDIRPDGGKESLSFSVVEDLDEAMERRRGNGKSKEEILKLRCDFKMATISFLDGFSLMVCEGTKRQNRSMELRHRIRQWENQVIEITENNRSMKYLILSIVGGLVGCLFLFCCCCMAMKLGLHKGQASYRKGRRASNTSSTKTREVDLG